MDQTYVVIRGSSDASDVTRGGLESLETASPSDLDFTVEAEHVDTKAELDDLAADPTVHSLAESIPMVLHEPVDMQVEVESDPVATWGVRAVRADTSPHDGSGITVAVLDTGIDATHPAFAGVNVVQRDFTGEGDGDGNGHGTHCAGTIFGQDVDGLRIGVARNIDRALIGKVLGTTGGGSTEGIAGAIQWALDQGAHVISMSLGIDFPGFVQRLVADGFPADLATSRALAAYRSNIDLFAALAQLAQARGGFPGMTPSLLVAAAGNESKRDADPDHEIEVAPPAAAAGFISVGALGESPGGLRVAGFSNTGPRISGPGVGIRSARAGGGLRSLNGTSMATPHVAGVAALWAGKLLDENPAMTTSELEGRLIGSGDRTVMAQPFDPTDVGTGLVLAPQH